MAQIPHHPATQYPRSTSRRRRSSTSDHSPSLSKHRRTGTYLDVNSDRQATSSPEQLCDQCRCIDLSRIISSQQHISSPKGNFITYLEWDSEQQCALCDFFKAMRISLPLNATTLANRNGNSDEEARGPIYHLRACSAMSSYREYFFRPQSRRRTRPGGDIMLAVVPNGLFSDKKDREQYVETFGQVGFILPVAHVSTAPWLTGRPVGSQRVDFPAIQAWFHFCKKNHQCSMRYSRPDKLNVIDCKTMKIVIAPSNCNYFALSYVWGKPTGSSTAQSSEPHPDATNTLMKLAPVVQDTVSVVNSLGWRYLWVDKYCIPQSDPVLKSEHLQKMDLIYEGAYCTIVAAAGANDQHGLPGISCPRLQQPSFNNGRDHFVSTLPDPQMEIKTSPWMTRAWTYQEALCSARRLILTPHQVYFECKAMHCCEAVYIPLNHLQSSDRKATLPHIRPILFGDEWLQGTHRFGPISAFWSVVKQYSKRRMTYDSDALSALEGILRRFQASPSFVHNVLGLPIHADPSHGKEALLKPALFIAALSWSCIGAPRRRSSFPSWTWAGWTGAIDFQRTFGNVGYEACMELWVEDKDGERVPWSQFWHGFWMPEGKRQCLAKFSCIVVEADGFKVRLVVCKGNLLQGQWRVDMLNPYNDFRLASIILPMDLIDSSRIKSDLWDCIILGRKTKGGDPDFMLIRWSGGVAERVWVGTLFSRRHGHGPIDACLPPLLRRKFRLK